jgi:ubiquitin carboxyl-terminal hydrolase 34
LTIKDKRSVHESLQELIKEETISDFECEKCQKKVDISKRTLIAHTPSVLFVHLQRLVFNFDTFQNDKVNTLCEFPDVLDLKPYSFYYNMEKEGRLKKKQDDQEDDDDEEEVDEEELKKRAEEQKSWPEEESCYEYKLVGATIHSGTANAGHYWSYINTKRGNEENEGSEDWIHTDIDPWMEFNDSTVRDLDFKKVQEDGYGGEQTSSGWSAFSSSYGKSAYMLVYERREKKPVKVLVDKEEEGAIKDEEKDEHYKLISFKDAAKPTGNCPIY